MIDFDNIQVNTKISFEVPLDDGRIFQIGEGVMQLCKIVDETGSLNKAAKSMKMAYSKAWRIINKAESALGFPLIIKQRPQGSVLSEEGKNLSKTYFEICEQVKQFSNDKKNQIIMRY